MLSGQIDQILCVIWHRLEQIVWLWDDNRIVIDLRFGQKSPECLTRALGRPYVFQHSENGLTHASDQDNYERAIEAYFEDGVFHSVIARSGRFDGGQVKREHEE